MDSLWAAPGSYQVCSELYPPQLEGQFSHMTSSTASQSFSQPTCARDRQTGSLSHLNDGDTDHGAWSIKGGEIMVE